MGKQRRARRGQSETSAPESRQATHAARGRVRLYAAFLALAAVAVYWNSIPAPFTFDDPVSVTDNVTIRHLWPLWDALSPPAGGFPVSGRPLANLSLAINYALGGLDVRGYHITNITLHVLCAWLLFGIIRRTLESRVLQQRFAPGTASRLAFVCALIWMLHPLQTETIDYVSKRTELMMSLFYLLTLYGSIRAVGSSRAGAWLGVSVLSCALGMACKESMVTAPLMVVLYDATFVSGSFLEAVRRRGRFYGALALTWVVLAALIWSAPRGFTAGFTTRLTSWTYLLNESKMIVRYLQLTVWPHSLVLDYGEPLPMTLAAAAPYAAVVVILVLITAVALVWWPVWGFLGAWFVVILAPTSSVIPIATEVGAESRMYLPLAAIVSAIVIAGYRLCERLSNGTRVAGRTSRTAWIGGAIAVVAAVCVALAAGTRHRNDDYLSPVTLWRTVVYRWPHARAHRDLADALRKTGDREEVVSQLLEAIRDQPDARYALGQVLFDQGRMREAVTELRQAIDEIPADPNATQAGDLIGRAYASQGQRAEAASAFRQVLQASPSDVVAQGGLADALFAQGDFEGAAAAYVAFLKSRPDNAAAWQYLGVALFRSGQKQQGAKALARAVELNPGDGEVQRNLASMLLDLRDVDGALQHAELAVRLLPGDASAQTMLAAALAAKKTAPHSRPSR
jgi:tetratricopeptide (TPR) repeat protein